MYEGVLQTLQKTLFVVADDEGSRKSSTRQPGNVSIKYSDMLLVEIEQLSLIWLSSAWYIVEGIELELKIPLETAEVLALVTDEYEDRILF